MAQPISAQSDEICQSAIDVQDQVKRLKECEIDQRELVLLRDTIILRDKTISTIEKELDLEKRENELNKKIIDIKDQEVIATRRALYDMEKVTDRAIELAKVSKPSTNWQLQGLLGLAAFVAGVLIGK
jgi:hypothetical protein